MNNALLIGITMAILASCATTSKRDPKPENAPPKNGTGTHVPVDDPLEKTPQPVPAHEPFSGVTYAARIGTRLVRLELADTPALRGTGLAGRERLEHEAGMIFLYPSAQDRGFWMKGCRIGLDIAYLDDDRKITSIGSLDPPTGEVPDESDDFPRFRSTEPARYVVEMEKGWFARAGIEPGTVVTFSTALKRRADAVKY